MFKLNMPLTNKLYSGKHIRTQGWSVLGRSESQQSIKFDEAGCWVPHVPFVFGCAPIEWVLVVPIVETFADGCDGYQVVISWFDVLVPWTATEHVADGIDTPCGVEEQAIVQCCVEVPNNGVYVEDISVDQRRHHKAHQEGHFVLVAFLEHHDGIGNEIVHVDVSALIDHLLRFFLK